MTAPATARRTYKLGAVLPHVRWAAEEVGNRYGVGTILGWRATARDMAGHPAGRALDYMTSSSAQGWEIVAHLSANAEGYAVDYLIFERTYIKPDGTREPMEDRGSPTQNHMDHVHAQFKVRPGTKDVGKRSGYIANPATDGPLERLVDAVNPFDGWQTDALAVGIKLTVAGAALALIVAGAARTVTPGGTAP